MARADGRRPARRLVQLLGWQAPEGTLLTTWSFVMEHQRDRATRLIVRARGGQDYRFHGLPGWATNRVVQLVHFVMERKQLLGIARRAEHA